MANPITVSAEPRLTVTDSVVSILTSESIPNVFPQYGRGIDIEKVEKRVKECDQAVVYVQSSMNSLEDIHVSSFGEYTAANVLLWTFARVAKHAVERMLDILKLGYFQDGNFQPRTPAPFLIGGCQFIEFNPIGGFIDETADKYGQIYINEQAINIRYNTN